MSRPPAPPISPQPGNDRDPRNFVGRVATTTRARERLTVGANLLLADPRRLGKTYWMHTFAAREEAFQCYIIDYEGVFTVDEFLAKTAHGLLTNPNLPQRARKVLGTIFDCIESVDAGVPGILSIKTFHRQTSPHRLLTNVLRTLDDGTGPIPLVLMDEVPMAIDNIAEGEGPLHAKKLLQTLRALRQETTRVRWIVTGSIGFHHVLRRAGTTSGDINDLETLNLGVMPTNESQELAQRLILGIGQMPGDAVVDELVEVAGGVPSIMHKVASLLRQEGHATIRPHDVREAFEQSIDNRDEFQWLKQIDERISKNYRQHADLTRRILAASLSYERAWVPLTDLPQHAATSSIIEDLCADHYLEQRGLEVRWRYPSFQYIWARHKRIWDRR